MESSLLFEISLRSIWKKWNLHWSEFHFSWTNMNANNKLTLHRSESIPRSEISNWSEFSHVLGPLQLGTRYSIIIFIESSLFVSFYFKGIVCINKLCIIFCWRNLFQCLTGNKKKHSFSLSMVTDFIKNVFNFPDIQ